MPRASVERARLFAYALACPAVSRGDAHRTSDCRSIFFLSTIHSEYGKAECPRISSRFWASSASQSR